MPCIRGVLFCGNARPFIIRQTKKLTDDLILNPKFKCHPTIPCDIPRTAEDIDALWYHVPDELLPINWTSDWLKIPSRWFVPNPRSTYSMGTLDIFLKAFFGISYPIKGVMYQPERLVFEDALGEYYFRDERWQLEYLAKFRAPRWTTVSDFVKHHFHGGVNGVDMDLVLPDKVCGLDRCDTLALEQWDLAILQEEAQAQSRCACQHASRDAKRKNLKLVG